MPGEEYSVGVLYAILAELVPKASDKITYWLRVITFSTQGIDSLALRDPAASAPLTDENIAAVEYKYEFSNGGPFNHALAVVDCIIAWNVDVDCSHPIRDQFTCFGQIEKIKSNDFEWCISGIEDANGAVYEQKVAVYDLRKLIEATFDGVKFVTPS